MKIFICIIFALLAAPALAQQPSAEVQALYSRLTSEVNTSIQCSMAAINLNRQLHEAKELIKALQEKYEPAADKKPD